MSKGAKRNKEMGSDSDDEFEKDFKPKKDKKEASSKPKMILDSDEEDATKSKSNAKKPLQSPLSTVENKKAEKEIVIIEAKSKLVEMEKKQDKTVMVETAQVDKTKTSSKAKKKRADSYCNDNDDYDDGGDSDYGESEKSKSKKSKDQDAKKTLAKEKSNQAPNELAHIQEQNKEINQVVELVAEETKTSKTKQAEPKEAKSKMKKLASDFNDDDSDFDDFKKPKSKPKPKTEATKKTKTPSKTENAKKTLAKEKPKSNDQVAAKVDEQTPSKSITVQDQISTNENSKENVVVVVEAKEASRDESPKLIAKTASKESKVKSKKAHSDYEDDDEQDDFEDDDSDDEEFAKPKRTRASRVTKKSTKPNSSVEVEPTGAAIQQQENKENAAHENSSYSKLLNKTLPSATERTAKPFKRVERTSIGGDKAMSSSNKTPLGAIEIKTPQTLRLGLSRNSRPKPLHPNLKPATN